MQEELLPFPWLEKWREICFLIKTNPNPPLPLQALAPTILAFFALTRTQILKRTGKAACPKWETVLRHFGWTVLKKQEKGPIKLKYYQHQHCFYWIWRPLRVKYTLSQKWLLIKPILRCVWCFLLFLDPCLEPASCSCWLLDATVQRPHLPLQTYPPVRKPEVQGG